MKNCYKKSGKVFDKKKMLHEKSTSMKETNSISTLLGIKQEDMAMLLRISRSQWSLYELGKRDLPLAAKQLLAEMLQFVQSPVTAKGKAISHVAQQEAKKKQELEGLLKENEYQMLTATKKLETIEQKYVGNLNALQLVDHLAAQPHHKAAFNERILQIIASKATKTLTKNSLATLTKHKHQVELLQLEKMLLESSLRKMNKTPEI